MDETRPSLELTSVTICTPAPRDSAAFYSRLLGAKITSSQPGKPHEDGWAQVKTERLTLNFEYEQSWSAPVWPSQVSKQSATQHLDILAPDLPAAIYWALQCGAREATEQPQDKVRVMVDPQGHPFCLFS